MKRNHFLKTTFFCGLALLYILLNSFNLFQENYTRNQLIGKGNPDIVGTSYTSKMHKDAKLAFQKMKDAALKDGINIEVVSSYRSFKKQKSIFENKYQRFLKEGLTPTESISKTIEYSTIPGTSRHHWGTDIDIIDANSPKPKSVLEEEHFYGNGPYCKLKEWMDKNSESFGFYEVYTQNPSRKGFKHEPWHFSFAPISIPMLKSYNDLDIKSILKEEKVIGNEYFTEDFIIQYKKENIMDINPNLL